MITIYSQSLALVQESETLWTSTPIHLMFQSNTTFDCESGGACQIKAGACQRVKYGNMDGLGP